jgi:arsenate reductase
VLFPNGVEFVSGEIVARPRILFVCIENSCRSQMAEAFARLEGGDAVEVWSAGSRPSGIINPRAIDSMKEIGFALSGHKSKGLNALPEGAFSAVVTMGCGDACPNVPADLREDWEIPDPNDMDPEAFAQVRDEIGRRVRELLRRIQP